MRKIINFIVLVLFVTTLVSNYSYSNKDIKTRKDKLALITGLHTGKAEDILFTDIHDIIQKHSDERGVDLFEEIEDFYYSLKDSTDIIEDIIIDWIEHEDIIEVRTTIQTKRKKYINKTTIYKPIWDESDNQLLELCGKLNEQNPYIYVRQIKHILYDYYDGMQLDYKSKQVLLYILRSITLLITKNKNDEDLLYESLKVVRVLIKNLDNNNVRKEKLTRFTREIIKTLNSIRRKKTANIYLKQDMIYNLLFLYDKILLKKQDIKNLDYIKKQLTAKNNKFDEHEALRNLGNIASILVKHNKYNNDKIGKTEFLKEKSIREIINILGQNLKKQKLNVELKKEIINKLIFIYDNTALRNKDIIILNNIKSKLMSKNYGFYEEKKLKNLAWIAAIFIKQGKYKKKQIIIQEVIKEIIETLERTIDSSSNDTKLKRKTLASLGSIGQHLIAKKYIQDSNDLIVKFFKKVIEEKKYNLDIRTKAIGQLYGIGKKLIQESQYKEAEEIITYLKTIIQKTKIRRKCVAEIGALLLRYEEAAPSSEFANDLKEYMEEFTKQPYSSSIIKTAKRLLNEFDYIREQREAQKIVKAIPEERMRKLTESEKDTIEKKPKAQRRKRRKRKKKKVLMNISPEISKITKKLIGKIHWERIKEDKHLKNYYIEHVVPHIEALLKIKDPDTMSNGSKNFIKPIQKLKLELERMIFDYKADYPTIIKCFDNLKGKEKRKEEKKVQKLERYLEKNSRHNKIMTVLKKHLYLDQIDTTLNLEILPFCAEYCSFKIKNIHKDKYLKSIIKHPKNTALDEVLESITDSSRRLLKNKLDKIITSYEGLGKGNTKEIKQLIRIREDLAIDTQLYIYHTTKIGTLKDLEKIGLITIKKINGTDHVINKVRNWPNIVYVNTGYYSSNKDNFENFTGLINAMRECGSIRVDYITQNKTKKHLNDNISQKLTKELTKKSSSTLKWPQDRSKIRAIVPYYQNFQNESGLHDIQFTFFLTFLSPKLIKAYQSSSDIYEHLICPHQHPNITITDLIKATKKPTKYSDFKDTKKIVVLLKSTIDKKTILSIPNLLKKNDEVTFVTENPKNYHDNKDERIMFSEETTGILGTTIKFNQTLDEHTLYMNKDGQMLGQNHKNKKRLEFKSIIPSLVEDILTNIEWKLTGEKKMIKLIREKISIDKNKFIKTQISSDTDTRNISIDTKRYLILDNLLKEKLTNYENEKEKNKKEHNFYNFDKTSNTDKDILLFIALELKEKNLIKKLIDNGACLDIETKDGKNPFTIAKDNAQKYGDLSIFELLMSKLDRPKVVSEEYKEIEKDIKRCVMSLYMKELFFLKKLKIEIDYIKDFNKLKMLKQINNMFKTAIKIGSMTLTKELFQELAITIYDDPTASPTLENLKLLKQAV